VKFDKIKKHTFEFTFNVFFVHLFPCGFLYIKHFLYNDFMDLRIYIMINYGLF
jgi:hypothetical protein